MKSYFLLFILLFSLMYSFAQNLAPIDVRVQNLYYGALRNVNNGTAQNGQNRLYWSEEWSKGIIKLKNGGQVDAFPIRIDLLGQGLEIFLGKETKLLPASMVKEFYIELSDGQSHHFINPSIYFESEELVEGFFEVLEEGAWTLLIKAEIEVSDPDKGSAATASFVNHNAIRRDRFYLLYQRELIRIPKQKGRAVKVLEPFIPNIKTLTKIDKINFSQQASLRLLVIDLNAKGNNSPDR